MSDFNAGSIEGHLELNTSAFYSGLRKAKEDAKDFERGKISAKMELDKTDFDSKKDEAEADKADLGKDVKSKFDLDITGALGKIALLKMALDSVKGKLGFGGAGSDLASDSESGGNFLSRMLGGKLSRSLAADKNGGIGKLLDAGGLGSLITGGVFSSAGRQTAKYTGLGALGGGALSVIPSLLSGLGSATAGIVAFGAAAAVGGVVLEGAFKGYSALVKNDIKDLKKNPNAYGARGRAFLADEKALGATQNRFQAATLPGVLGVAGGAVNLANAVLPKLVPIVNTISSGLVGVEKIIEGIVNSKGFASFLQSVQGFLDGFLKGAAPLIGTVLTTFFTAFEKLQPILAIIGTLLKDAVDGIAKFVGNISSKQIQGWANDVLSLIPKVIGVVMNVFKAVKGVLGDLAPEMKPFLTLIETLGKTLAGLDLKPLAQGFGSILSGVTPLVPVLGQILNALLPPLGKLMTTLSQDVLLPLGKGLGELLVPVLGTLSRTLTQLAGPLGDFMASIANLANPEGIGLIANLLSGLLKAAVPLFRPLSQIGIALESMLDNALKIMGPFLEVIVKGLGAMIKVLAPVVTWIAKILDWGPIPKILGLVTAAFVALWAVLAVNPVVLVIGVIALLVGALVKAYNHSKVFRDIVNGVGHVLYDMFIAPLKIAWNILKDVFEWVGGHWKLLAEIILFPFVGPIALIVKLLGGIKNVTKDVTGFLKDAWNGLKDVFSTVGGWIDDVYNAIKNVVNIVVGPLTKAFDSIKSVVGGVKGIVGGVGGFIGKGLHALGFATGGTVTSNGLTLVGENGPEIAQLPPGTKVTPTSTTNQTLENFGSTQVGILTQMLRTLAGGLSHQNDTDTMVEVLSKAFSKAQVDAARQIIQIQRAQ